MPKKQRKMVEAWISIHENELDALWKQIKDSGEYFKIEPLIKEYAIFQRLISNKKLFDKVTVDAGGYGISWNEEIDLAAEEIWKKGERL